MLHRQTSVPPLIPSGQSGGAPPVNPPPAQPSVPVSQPQPGVSFSLSLLFVIWLENSNGKLKLEWSVLRALIRIISLLYNPYYAMYHLSLMYCSIIMTSFNVIVEISKR